MIFLLTIIHVLVCVFLIIVVLLQSGKAADLAGAFGGMGSQTAFGPRGSATLLSKATTVSAVVFMVTSLSLSIMATRSAGTVGSTVLDKAKQPAPASTPAKPGQNPASAPVIPAAPQSSAPAPGAKPSVSLSTDASGKTETKPVEIPAVPPQVPPAQSPSKKQ